MDNEIVYTGTHTIMLRKGDKPENHYWSSYAYEGHIMKMNRPKKGQLVRLPFGELCKIVNTGTEWITSTSRRGTQYLAVYVVRVPG